MKKWVVLGFALLFAAALAGAPSPAAAELKVGVSGYVKLDVLNSDKITGSDPSPSPANTPLDPATGSPFLDASREKDNSQTLLDARESRLRVTFSDEVAGVKLSGRIETDFFTAEGSALTSNSRGLRLRHAFARADHPSGFFLLAGQYWSLFMNSDIAQPDLVDFNGPAGQIFARQPQLRVGYKNPLGRGNGDLVVEAAIEKHSHDNGDPAGLTAANVAPSAGEGQTTPLFAGKVSWLHPRFQAEAAFAVAENTAILETTGNDVSKSAFGFQVSAQANIVDPLTIFAHWQVIDGLNRLANGDFPTAFVLAPAPGRLENVESTGFYFGATYNLTKDTSVTGMYGWAEADEIPGSVGACTAATSPAACVTGFGLESHTSLHLNIIHKFWQRWQAGLEFRRFEVEAFNGTDGDVNIVHGALWFFF